MSLIKLKYGNTNTFLINGLLFDTDMAGMLNPFYKCLKQNGLTPNSIKYVLCSHYHPDHMGLVSELNKLGIKLVVLENQKQNLHFSDNIFAKQFGAEYSPIGENNAIEISFKESRNFLAQLEIHGEIIPTTSHSQDGIALILDDGNCLVGDLEPAQFIDGYVNNQALQKDWQEIMNHHPKIIYYGHSNSQKV